MDFCIDRLKEGGWVHIFPEGGVNMTKENMRLKWGVGRLVYDCPNTPLVIPFYHIGMDTVLPNSRPYIPHVFKRVTVFVGDPIDLKDTVQNLRDQNVDHETARKVITDILQEKLYQLRPKAEKLHNENEKLS